MPFVMQEFLGGAGSEVENGLMSISVKLQQPKFQEFKLDAEVKPVETKPQTLDELLDELEFEDAKIKEKEMTEIEYDSDDEELECLEYEPQDSIFGNEESKL